MLLLGRVSIQLGNLNAAGQSAPYGCISLHGQLSIKQEIES